MARLNLICSGMMFFNEAGDGIQIVIPDLGKGHVRKFCPDRQSPVQTDTVDLDDGSYELTGIASSNCRLAELMDSNGYVVLDGNKVGFDEAAARSKSAFITVPKPSIIRLYRAAEALPGFDFMGNASRAALRVPGVIHDIVILSYRDLPEGSNISIGLNGAPEPLAKATPADLVTVNWVLYADDEAPFPVDPEASEHETAEVLVPLRHPTPINDFLKLNLPGQSVSGQSASGQSAVVSAQTTLNLSGIGKRDTPGQPAIGMSSRHLFLFHELPKKAGGPEIKPVCGEASCSGAVRVAPQI